MTTKRHPENEKAKHNYLQFLRDVKGRDESSIDQVAKALERFDDYNRRRDFGKFHIQQARGFKTHLTAQRNIRTGAPLSASTVVSTLGMLKAFFIWLSGEAGYCQMFSTGFNSGEREGRKIGVMFLGILSFPVVCHPARSSSRTACARFATCREISSR